MEPITIAAIVGTFIGTALAAAIGKGDPDDAIRRYARKSKREMGSSATTETAAIIGAVQTSSYLLKRLETVERFQRDAEQRITDLEKRLQKKDEEIRDLNRKIEALRAYVQHEYGKEITDEELEALVKESHDETKPTIH